MALTYEEIATAECVQELAGALLRAAGDVLKNHGEGNNDNVIVAAGFAMALREAGKIAPLIPSVCRQMLAESVT